MLAELVIIYSSVDVYGLGGRASLLVFGKSREAKCIYRSRDALWEGLDFDFDWVRLGV